MNLIKARRVIFLAGLILNLKEAFGSLFKGAVISVMGDSEKLSGSGGLCNRDLAILDGGELAHNFFSYAVLKVRIRQLSKFHLIQVNSSNLTVLCCNGKNDDDFEGQSLEKNQG
ncbi:hypothetical protein RUND412_002364 [Rhizina undulata]